MAPARSGLLWAPLGVVGLRGALPGSVGRYLAPLRASSLLLGASWPVPELVRFRFWPASGPLLACLGPALAAASC